MGTRQFQNRAAGVKVANSRYMVAALDILLSGSAPTHSPRVNIEEAATCRVISELTRSWATPDPGDGEDAMAMNVTCSASET